MRYGVAIFCLLFVAGGCRHGSPAEASGPAGAAAHADATQAATPAAGPEATAPTGPSAREGCTSACEATYADRASSREAHGGCMSELSVALPLCSFADVADCVARRCEEDCAAALKHQFDDLVVHWCSESGPGYRWCRDEFCPRVPLCREQWCGDDKPSRKRFLAEIAATRDACLAECAKLR